MSRLRRLQFIGMARPLRTSTLLHVPTFQGSIESNCSGTINDVERHSDTWTFVAVQHGLYLVHKPRREEHKKPTLCLRTHLEGCTVDIATAHHLQKHDMLWASLQLARLQRSEREKYTDAKTLECHRFESLTWAISAPCRGSRKRRQPCDSPLATISRGADT